LHSQNKRTGTKNGQKEENEGVEGLFCGKDLEKSRTLKY
jgi:hypothetical protein